MKLRNLLLNLGIGMTTLVFGFGWVGLYDFFTSELSGVREVETQPAAGFDINDPESVLPIDYDEDELTFPDGDENNPGEFDPEGIYEVISYSSPGVSEFRGFELINKNYDVDCDDKTFGDPVKPVGYAAVSFNSLDIRVGEFYREDDKSTYQKFETLNLGIDGIEFRTAAKNGVSYEFNGDFLVKGNFYTLDPDAKVIKGVLTKRFGEKTVSVTRVVFKWRPDIACHC